jgi:hypothetical protein
VIELFEKQYAVDDGVAFGLGCPIEIKSDGWTPGSAELRTQDVDNPGYDGVRPGRTFKGAATWSFSLYTNTESESAAWAAANQLARAWDDEEVRLESGVIVPLQYCLAGKQRVVFGQPRRFTPSPGNTSMGGRIDIEADFLVVDDRSYDAEVQSLNMTLSGDPDPGVVGITTPFTTPFVMGVAATTAGAQRVLRIRGEVPTPITVKYSGSVTNPVVAVPGRWTAAVRDVVYAGDPVTVDARPWVRAASRQSGGGVEVSPRVTRITKMWLPPGDYPVTFSGESASGASALVSWRNAYKLPR